MRLRPLSILLVVASLLCVTVRGQQAPAPQWIWFPEGDPRKGAPMGERYFRKTFNLADEPVSAKIAITADDHFSLFINGHEIGRDNAGSNSWQRCVEFDVGAVLTTGKNVVAVRGFNDGVEAGLVVNLQVQLRNGDKLSIVTDGSWLASSSAPDNWLDAGCDDAKWAKAMALGEFGKTAPWGGAATTKLVLPAKRFKVPAGFVVEPVVEPSPGLGSIMAMTFDAAGRLTVATEGGPIKIIEGNLADNQPVTVKVFSDQVRNCQGLLWVDGDLFANGNGPEGAGLYRLHAGKSKDAADDVRCLGKYRGGMGEFGPHQIALGPDGFLYIALGNQVLPPESMALDSPLKDFYQGELLRGFADPNGLAKGIRAPGGTVCRVELDGKRWERFAGGFRNLYDLSFNAIGELFSVDSETSWDIGCPWYRPVRVNQIIAGGDYGWRSGTACMPDYFCDTLPPTLDIGRGTPTGATFYQHMQFPEKYRQALFVGDWSQGRILAVFPELTGASYSATSEIFCSGRPLNITDIEVGPDGALYFSTGGRGTEGAVFRIRHVEGSKTKPSGARSNVSVGWDWLSRPQPNAAWVREPLRDILRDPNRKTTIESDLVAFARDIKRNPDQRSQALIWLQQLGTPPREVTLVKLAEDEAATVRATVALLLGLLPTEASRIALGKLLVDPDLLVRRRASEGLVRIGLGDRTQMMVLPLLRDPSPWMRWAARKVLERTDKLGWVSDGLARQHVRQSIEILEALAIMRDDSTVADTVLRNCAVLLGQQMENEELLDLLRVIEIARINVRGPSDADLLVAQGLLEKFPAEDWRVNRELARLLVAFNVYSAKARIFMAMKREQSKDAQSSAPLQADEIQRNRPREMQIHYVYCVLASREPWTLSEKRQLAAWFETAKQWGGGYSFKGYLGKLQDEFGKILTDEDRVALLSNQPKTVPVPAGPPKLVRTSKSYSFDELAKYLEDDPAAKQGSVERGKSAFEALGCIRCHQHGSIGKRGLGPDLSELSSRLKPREILESIVNPAKTIADEYKQKIVTTKNGDTFTGLVVSSSDLKIQLVTADGKLIVVLKSDLASIDPAPGSFMPAKVLDGIALPDIADLFAFLQSGPASK